MLLDCDEQLFMTYKQGNVEGAENLLATWLEAEVDLQEDPKILGTSLLPKRFLVNEEMAMNIAFSTARKYWGRASTEMQMYFDKYGLDAKFVNDRLNAFFIRKKEKKLSLSSSLPNIQ